MADLLSELAAIVGDKHVLDAGAVSARPTSYWDSSPTRALGLVRPASTAEVAAVVALCHRRGQPVVTQGGRTGCVAGGDAEREELILSTERLDTIESVDRDAALATVQAGVPLQRLQEEVADAGLLFPLDLGARGSCTIGGNIATNAGGVNVLRYGMIRQLVLGLEVVLADGTVISAMNRMLKNNAGYDLKQYFIGSEGTLGVVTRAVLRLYPRPGNRQTAIAALDAFPAVAALLRSAREQLAGTLSAFEVMWGNYYDAVTGIGGHRPPLARGNAFYVIVESEGVEAEGDLERFMRLLEQSLESGLITDVVVPKSERECAELWRVREDFEQLLHPGPCYTYDVSLPVAAMVSYVEDVRARVLRSWPGAELYAFGHVADGNLHFFVRPNEPGEWHEVADRCVYEPLLPHDGSVSAEHGIGREKRRWLQRSRSAQELALMMALKRAMDPKGILNPGRVIAGTGPA